MCVSINLKVTAQIKDTLENELQGVLKLFDPKPLKPHIHFLSFILAVSCMCALLTLSDYLEAKNGLIFMLMVFREYQLPFQFIHTTPSSVPCLAIRRVYAPPM